MTLAEIGVGVLIGFFLGIGAAVFYMRWKLKTQLGAMQEQMEDMMDLTGGMEEMTEEMGLEELDEEDFEEEASEEKEE